MSQHLNKFQEELRRTVRIGAGLLLSIIAAGTVGYYFIEKLNILDSLYMTVITVSTVGFKEVGSQPFSPLGKIFTMVLILTSLGSLAYVGLNLARFILDGELAKYIKTYRVDKKIAKLKTMSLLWATDAMVNKLPWNWQKTVLTL